MKRDSTLKGDVQNSLFCISPFAGSTEAVNKPYSQNYADNIDDGGTQIRRETKKTMLISSSIRNTGRRGKNQHLPNRKGQNQKGKKLSLWHPKKGTANVEDIGGFCFLIDFVNRKILVKSSLVSISSNQIYEVRENKLPVLPAGKENCMVYGVQPQDSIPKLSSIWSIDVIFLRTSNNVYGFGIMHK